MSALPNRKNRNLWSLRLTDLGNEVKAFDGFGEDRIGILTSLRDDETYRLYDNGVIGQHLKRTAIIGGEPYEIWLSSNIQKEDL